MGENSWARAVDSETHPLFRNLHVLSTVLDQEDYQPLRAVAVTRGHIALATRGGHLLHVFNAADESQSDQFGERRPCLRCRLSRGFGRRLRDVLPSRARGVQSRRDLIHPSFRRPQAWAGTRSPAATPSRSTPPWPSARSSSSSGAGTGPSSSPCRFAPPHLSRFSPCGTHGCTPRNAPNSPAPLPGRNAHAPRASCNERSLSPHRTTAAWPCGRGRSRTASATGARSST